MCDSRCLGFLLGVEQTVVGGEVGDLYGGIPAGSKSCRHGFSCFRHDGCFWKLLLLNADRWVES